MRRHTTPFDINRFAGASLTRSRLGGAMLAYLLGITLVITLVPFQFIMPQHWRIMTSGGALDVVANVLLFIPLGFCYRLAQQNAARHSVLQVLAAGMLLSMVIEALQLFEPERYTSVIDVLTNASGALLGAALCARIARDTRTDVRVARRLLLELPLMGLVYLLTPLLWLNAIVSVAEPWRAWLGIPLVVFGAQVLGGVHREQLRDARPALFTAALAAVGAFIGMFPVVAAAPVAVIAAASAAFAVTLGAASRPSARLGTRRYEVPVLKESVWAFGLFGAGLLLTPALFPASAVPPVALGAGSPSRASIVAFLEVLATFSVLGYMLAEVRGRAETTGLARWKSTLGWGVGAALVAEGAMGLATPVSAARVAFCIASALYGAWLYQLQRDHVVTLLAEFRALRPVEGAERWKVAS